MMTRIDKRKPRHEPGLSGGMAQQTRYSTYHLLGLGQLKDESTADYT